MIEDLMARATPERSGDQLAGLAAEGPVERLAAQMALADLPLSTFLEQELISSDDDEVSALIARQHDARAFAPVASLTVGEFREWLLNSKVGQAELEAVTWGLTPEMVAAVSKIMRLQDLVAVSAKRQVVTSFRNTIGLSGRLSSRNQPNHPTDCSRRHCYLGRRRIVARQRRRGDRRQPGHKCLGGLHPRRAIA